MESMHLIVISCIDTLESHVVATDTDPEWLDMYETFAGVKYK